MVRQLFIQNRFLSIVGVQVVKMDGDAFSKQIELLDNVNLTGEKQ
jgi:hypothetical protein